jgi:hypothetical protein
MTTEKIFISVLIVLAITSCNNSSKQDDAKQKIPKALEDKSISSEVLSSRSYDDLVESLYNELLNKNQGLKKLEDEIQSLNESKNDSTKSFNNFNLKNQGYYGAANRHIDQLNDSTLKEKMKMLISSSLTKYNSVIVRHNEFLKIIDSKNITLSDLHTLLKITKTLQVIETYQNNNLPSTKSLKSYIKKQDEAIKLADTLLKQ